jgi:hypothetical protein
MATKKAAVKKSAAKKVIKKSPAKKNVQKSKTVTPPSPVKVISGKHIISQSDGEQMINRFMYYNKGTKLNLVKFSSGREFDVSLFTSILNTAGVKKIRFRNAVNANNEHTLVITGADEKGYDILIPVIVQQNSLMADTPPPTNGMGDMGDQCSDPKYK